MQYERAQNILSGQTSLAKKVFAAVPMQEYWTIGQISNEMHRKTPHGYSRGEITGCLRCLVDAGLVSEGGTLNFRSEVKPPKEAPEVTAPAKRLQTPKPTLMDQLLNLATDLRSIADKVDDIALEFDTAVKDAGKGNAELESLRATLRRLLGDS